MTFQSQSSFYCLSLHLFLLYNSLYMDILQNTKVQIIVANTGAQILIKLITSSTTLLLTLAVSYFFGLNTFGSFTKIIIFVSFFYLFIDFGINPIFLKEHYEHIEELFFNLISLRIILALITFLIIIFITFFLPYNSVTGVGFSPFEKGGIMLFSFTLFTYALILSINSLYQKLLLYHLTITPNLISSGVTLLFLIGGVAFHNIFIILFSYVLSGICLFLLLYQIIARHLVLKVKLERVIDFSRKLLTASFPIGLMLILNIIYFHADTMILSLYKPTIDVGIYGFSYKLFEFFIALPTFFSNSVYPILLEKAKNNDSFNREIKQYLLILLVLSVIITLIVFIFAPLLKLIKIEWAFSVMPLRILSLSFPFFFLTSLFQWILIIKNKKIHLIFIYFISMMINIFSNFIFIPKYSYIASSYITVFSEGIIFILMILAFLNLKRVEKF